MSPGPCTKKLGDGSVFACGLPQHYPDRGHLSAETIGELGGMQLGVEELQRRARLTALGLFISREPRP